MTETGKQEEADLGSVSGLYEEHSRSIYYLTLRMLGNSRRAEDATHDVFLKAYRSLHTFRRKSSPRTWLYRIAINHVKNIRQSWYSRKVIPAEELPDATGPVTEDGPLSALLNKELGELIQDCLAALPEEYRLLLLLVADKEMTYEQIAELTEQSVDAVRGKLFRARKVFIREFKNRS